MTRRLWPDRGERLNPVSWGRGPVRIVQDWRPSEAFAFVINGCGDPESKFTWEGHVIGFHFLIR